MATWGWIEGIQALVDALERVEAERFISLMLCEPFDYTQWRKETVARQIH